MTKKTTKTQQQKRNHATHWARVYGKTCTLVPSLTFPSVFEIADLIQPLVNAKTGFILGSRPKNLEGGSKYLWEWLRFLRSTGSLYCYPWFAPSELSEEEAERIANLALVICKNNNRAVESWKRALGK